MATSIGQFASLLILASLLGLLTVGVLQAVGNVVLASTTPRWQCYLWCLVVGLIVLHLRDFAGAVSTFGAYDW